jgi:hypothetical protein
MQRLLSQHCGCHKTGPGTAAMVGLHEIHPSPLLQERNHATPRCSTAIRVTFEAFLRRVAATPASPQLKYRLEVLHVLVNAILTACIRQGETSDNLTVVLL